MAYRTQSTRSQYRDVSPKEEDQSYAREIAAAATGFLGGELIALGKRNAQRKQINDALLLQSEANKVKLMTDIGALATEENGVNKAALKETSSAVIKAFSDAQLRVSQSTGSYVYKDPVTGEEKTREDDLKIISQSNDFINTIGEDIEANESLIGKLQEQLALNNIGNHPGAVDMSTVDPRILAISLGDDPSKGVKFTETYKVDYDPEKGYMTSIVYKGKGIEEANKALGIDGDEFTINTKSLASVLNDPDRNPANMFGYVSSNNFTGENNLFGKQASRLTDNGLIRDEFYLPGEVKTISLGGRKRQEVNQKALDYNQVHSALNGTSVAATKSSMRGNNPQQVLTDIKAYTKYDEKNDEYYYNTPELDANGNLQYDDKGAVKMKNEKTVLMKDGQLAFDQNELQKGLTEMYTQYQLRELGAYDKIRNIPVGDVYSIDKVDGGEDGGGVDTGLFKILRTTSEDDKDNLMIGGEDNILEIKGIDLGKDAGNVTGIGKDAEGLYVIEEGKKIREDKKYNFYKNALIESVDKTEKPSIIARFDELEKIEPIGSISIENVVKEVVNEAKKDTYQRSASVLGVRVPGVRLDNEAKFAEWLTSKGFTGINETDLRDVNLNNEDEVKNYIIEKIYESDENKNAAKAMQGGSKEAQGGYTIGQVVGGYRYKGGDPKKQQNWEKI